jgi:nicotinate-nucleotide adenylyltransferase
MSVIGVFGGSFDPPHVGHVLAVAYALATAPIERVLVVPTFRHPFGKAMAPFADRVAMAELAFGGMRGVEVSRIEEELGGDSYTVRTLEALRSRMPGTTLRLLVGSDVLPDTPRWREWERVTELAPPIVLPRGGELLPTVSSTDVRARYAAAGSTEDVVPRSVDAHVRSHGLYGAT